MNEVVVVRVSGDDREIILACVVPDLLIIGLIHQVALSAFTLAAEQTLSHLAKVVPGLAQTSVRAIAVIITMANSPVFPAQS